MPKSKRESRLSKGVSTAWRRGDFAHLTQYKELVQSAFWANVQGPAIFNQESVRSWPGIWLSVPHLWL